jgi:RNase P protein component
MRAYPFALLRPNSNTASYPFPSSNRHYSPGAVFKDKATQVPVGLVCIVGKKNVHNSAFIRSRIKSRMKEALRLVVARGANVDDEGKVMMYDDEIGESRWLLRGMLFSKDFREQFT